jgi:hypothetical protein
MTIMWQLSLTFREKRKKIRRNKNIFIGKKLKEEKN